MDFNLSEEHEAFADSMARFARKKLIAGALARAHSTAYPRETSALLTKQGLMAISFPEADGGQGGALMHAVLAIQVPDQLQLSAPRWPILTLLIGLFMIVPLWLYYFELWCGTGEWAGGGAHPDSTQRQWSCSRSAARV